MSERDIPFGRPMLDEAERQAVDRVLSGTTLVHGSATEEFENTFAHRCGVAHAVGVSSCTAGLHLSLAVLGIERGDRVAVPAMTHVATAHAVEFREARPLFVDVEADSGNLDAQALDALAAPDLKAVIPVHYLGLPCDMDAIGSVADRVGAAIVEDCALAIDASYDGMKVGSLGRTGCFSFYPVKHITTVEGGIVTTNDDALAAEIRQRRAFGYDRSLGRREMPGIYDVTALGYNYRMNEVQAAIGLVQLRKLDAFQKARAENYQVLQSSLAELDEVTVFEPERGKARSSHYCLNAVLPRDGSVDRPAVVRALRDAGVGSSVHYPSAVPLLSYYREKYGYRSGEFPVAEWLASQTISLPVGPHLTLDDAGYVGRVFKEALRKNRRRSA